MRRVLWLPCWACVTLAILALALLGSALRSAAEALVPAQKFLTRRMEGSA